MSKKNIKRTTKGLSPKPVVKHDDTVFIVREDLDEEQERVKTAAVGGLNAPAPTSAAEQPPAASAVPSKPLAPLAALWPSSEPPTAGTKLPPAPTPQVETVPVAATAPNASPAVAPTAPRMVNVSFALLKPNAKQVSVCGEFNGWSPSATPLERHNAGHWEATFALAPGRYQYKFLVDGEWLLDPAAQTNVPNEHGSLNSVLEVCA